MRNQIDQLVRHGDRRCRDVFNGGELSVSARPEGQLLNRV